MTFTSQFSYMFHLSPLEDWLADSLLEIKCDHTENRKDTRWIKERIRTQLDEEVTNLLEKVNYKEDPLNFEKLYSHRKILQVEEKEKILYAPKETMGIIAASPHGGFKIEIKKGLDPISKRMVLAHELGHTFLFDLSGKYPTMPDLASSSFPSNYFLKYSNSYTNRLTENDIILIREGYASEIGALLLVPKKIRKKIIEETNITTIKSLNKLNLEQLSDELQVTPPLLKNSLINYINHKRKDLPIIPPIFKGNDDRYHKLGYEYRSK